MSVFTGSLIIEEIVPGRRWRLCEPIRYEAGTEGSGNWIVVPKGFETDGASLPRFLRLFLSVWGTYGRAACVHDYLYAAMSKPKYQETVVLSKGRHRRFADREFYTAMIACGTSKPLAFLMWAAVRVFGGISQKGRI